MATWQFSLTVIPRDFLGNIDTPWEKVNVDEKAINQLARIFPPSESWSPNSRIFGIKDGTCISVWSENGKPLDIIVRLDMRSVQLSDIHAILEFVNLIDGQFQDEGGHQIKPVLQALLTAMEASPAHQFVKDPAEFFSSIRSRRASEDT